jgi:hypothetical protein
MPLLIKPWTDEEIATVVAMRDAGKPLYIIANKVGRSKAAIRHAFRLIRERDADAKTDA